MDGKSHSRSASSSERQGLVKVALELGPLIIFFLVNARSDLIYATGAFMIATLSALTISYVLYRKIPAMPLVSGIVIVVFGGLTLWLQDELFIKLKPTIVNLLFASLLLGGLAFFRRPLLQLVFGSVFSLDEEGWRKLSLRWGLYFVFLAVLNEVVWRNFSTDTWVSFKVFGLVPLTSLFAVAQFRLIQRHQIADEAHAPALQDD